jgi:tetratricopeptide (TPR) repeat protein
MQAIIATPENAIDINRRALLLAETSADERTKLWAGSLYNNLGWGYFDMGRYEEALSVFLKALEWRMQKNQPAETFMAKWCVARTLRALNKLEEALKIQLALLEEMIETDKVDGYVYEELAEIHLLKNDEVYKMYFNMAWHELKEDVWLSSHEQERLNRIKKLSE